MRKLRRLNSSYLELILNMNINFREGFANEDKLKEFLEDDNNFFYACIFNEKIIGFLYAMC